MAYDKSVFILGAGASVPANGPLLKDFLRRARELLDNPNSLLDDDEREIFKRVFDWKFEKYPLPRFLNLDLENIENLFCLVDMSCQLGFNKAKDTRNDLIRVISRTLDLEIRFDKLDHQRIIDKEESKTIKDSCSSILSINDNINEQVTDQTYFKFIEMLFRWTYSHGKDVTKTGYDSIITLNYDIGYDKALDAQGIPFTYDAHWSGDSDSGFKLLRLHGSTNWRRCTKCKKIKVEKEFDKLTKIPDSTLYNIEIAKRIYNTPCECGGKCIPFIVPPTWNKLEYSKDLSCIWTSASKELEQATRLIIIGYSLPETDNFFKYLLALGLSKNQSLQQIIIINPERGSEGRELNMRYANFITKSFNILEFDTWQVRFQEGIELLGMWRNNSKDFKIKRQQYEEEVKNQ